jgi:toxin CptA
VTAGPHTLSVRFRPSRLLAVVLVAAHLGAVAVVWSANLPLLLMLALKMAIAISLAWTTWSTALRRAPRSVIALEVDADGAARALQRDGEWIDCRVDGASFVAPFLIVILLHRVGGSGHRPSALLPPDSAPAAELRALRVWLRWRMRQPAGSGRQGEI